MAAPTLAKPTFVSGPQDSLATADVYKQQGGIINSIQDQLNNLGISIPDVIRGGKALAGLLPIVTGFKNGSLSISNPAALVTRLLSSSSAITSAFKMMGPDAQGAILGGLKEYGPVTVTLAGLTSQVNVTNFNNLNQVGNLISSFTNGASQMGIVDKDSIASVVGGIVSQAGSYGIPNSYAAITHGLTDLDILSKAAGLSIPSVVKNSDVFSLKSMSTALPEGALNLLNPTVINQFTMGYTRSTASTPNPAPENDHQSFTTLFDTYNSVDSTWNQCTRANTNTLDISSIMGGSADFVSMVQNGVKQLGVNDPSLNYVLAAVHQPTTVLASLAKNFPQTILKTGTSTTRSVDPRTAGVWDKLNSLLPSTTLAMQPATNSNPIFAGA